MMKNLLFTIAIVVTTFTVSSAQDQNTAAKANTVTASQQPHRAKMIDLAKIDAQKEVDRLDKALTLDQKQKEAVYGTMMKVSLSKQQMGQEHPEIIKQMDQYQAEQYKHIFTADQLQKYKGVSATR